MLLHWPTAGWHYCSVCLSWSHDCCCCCCGCPTELTAALRSLSGRQHLLLALLQLSAACLLADPLVRALRCPSGACAAAGTEKQHVRAFATYTKNGASLPAGSAQAKGIAACTSGCLRPEHNMFAGTFTAAYIHTHLVAVAIFLLEREAAAQHPHAAAHHDAYPVSKGIRLLHAVRGEHHGCVLLGCVDGIPHSATADGVHACKQKKQQGQVEDCLTNPSPGRTTVSGCE